jgi:hypothetical protein
MLEALMTPNGVAPRERTPAAVRADNIIRQRLRISDPGDSRAVAEALLRRFPQEGQALEREASGLPFAPSALLPALPVAAISTPSGAELDQATGDVERDLQALLTDNQLKDIEAELEGWGQAIRNIVADGTAAARVALDPRQRDRALAARRQLADYARLARLVGAVTPGRNMAYRRLAQSLDEVSALLLVLTGETLAATGLSGGRALLAAPASELQARRDAVLTALRRLTGSVDEAYGASEWPRGLHALRLLLTWLDESGHAELRAYLDENNMARLMDELIDRAANASARGLRALGATAGVTLQQLERLLQISNQRVDPESPVLSTFRNALRLFIDAFRASAGQRLLAIARPAIVFYGIYGGGQTDLATLRLQRLVTERGRLAQLLDCFLGCGCEDDQIVCQAVLDSLLCGIDRAIDLFAMGSDANGDGEPEQRASAYGILAELVALTVGPALGGLPGGLPNFPPYRPPGSLADESLSDLLAKTFVGSLKGQAKLVECLVQITGVLLPSNAPAQVPKRPFVIPRDERRPARVQAELCLQRRGEMRLFDLAHTMGQGCTDVARAHVAVDALLAAGLSWAGSPNMVCPLILDDLPPTPDTTLAGLVYSRFSEGS